MTALSEEIHKALEDIKNTLETRGHLLEREMEILLLTSLLEEESN